MGVPTRLRRTLLYPAAFLDVQLHDLPVTCGVDWCRGFLGGGFKYFFNFHPYLGKMSPFWSILTHIFHMGWNHQLGLVSKFRFLSQEAFLEPQMMEYVLFSPWNLTWHLKRCHPERKTMFQPFVCWCYVPFMQCVYADVLTVEGWCSNGWHDDLFLRGCFVCFEIYHTMATTFGRCSIFSVYIILSQNKVWWIVSQTVQEGPTERLL